MIGPSTDRLKIVKAIRNLKLPQNFPTVKESHNFLFLQRPGLTDEIKTKIKKTE